MMGNWPPSFASAPGAALRLSRAKVPQRLFSLPEAARNHQFSVPYSPSFLSLRVTSKDKLLINAIDLWPLPMLLL